MTRTWPVLGTALASVAALAVALLLAPWRLCRADDCPPGSITTVAGSGRSGYALGGYSGDGGPATAARLSAPNDVAVGPDGSLYIADRDNHRIRKVAPTGVITTAAGNGRRGYSGDGGPATEASLNWPCGVDLGPDGSLYIADTRNMRIRMVAHDGIISTVAGDGWREQRGGRYAGDGGPATQASIGTAFDIAVARDGSVYVADGNNNRVRKVDAQGIISTVAGNGTSGYSGDGGRATDATLRGPSGVALGGDGSVYIADTGNHCIRKVDNAGVITTVAGRRAPCHSDLGDRSPAAMGNLCTPFGLAVGPDGSLYISDYTHIRIRRIDSEGVITTVAGTGVGGFSGDGGPPTEATLDQPHGIAVGPDGSLYIADRDNHRVRTVCGEQVAE
jgi:sugar lactone lactonase YvrE